MRECEQAASAIVITVSIVLRFSSALYQCTLVHGAHRSYARIGAGCQGLVSYYTLVVQGGPICGGKVKVTVVIV